MERPLRFAVVKLSEPLPPLRANGSRQGAPRCQAPRSNPCRAKKKQWVGSGEEELVLIGGLNPEGNAVFHCVLKDWPNPPRHWEPTGRRKAPPDDRLREAIHGAQKRKHGLLRRCAPRNDAWEEV